MSGSENKELTPERMQIYEIAFAMCIKFILVVAGLIAFFIVLYYLVNEKDNTSKMIYMGFNTILGGSIFIVYRHYFPNKK